MKVVKHFIIFLAIIIALTISAKSAFASELKPQLNWQRSTEAPDKIVTETVLGSKINEALTLPLDPNQQVFDNGNFTPQINKDAVGSDIDWASWKQNSAVPGNGCGPLLELRRFNTKLNLTTNNNQITGVKLVSPYYPNNAFPINDNAYIYINGHLVKTVGTSYGANWIGSSGHAPYANETDGWVGDGDLGANSAQYLIQGENNIDVVAGETCEWGGMGKLDLVLDYNGPVPTPTPSPTPTPTPVPSPFLDLPWSYQRKGLSFEQVALNPYSWFDHEYPLQNISCCVPKIMKYTGMITNDYYRSHSGYDYGFDDGVDINTHVLAAASGWATFIPESKSGGGGNVIKVDHGNGYQTWYEHLQGEGLITKDEEAKVFVNKGQEIGKVGMTGNTTGPHIHLSVFKDINDNGSFNDDYPLGMTDPLGWEGNHPDPWPKDKGGAQSYNLFIARQQPTTQNIPATGGSIGNDKITVSLPQNAVNSEIKISLEYGPFESFSNLVTSAIPSFFIDAFDLNNLKISQLNQPATLTYDYSNADLSNINESSLKMYSFNEESLSWEELSTTLDAINKTAAAQTPHFSQFALMGEVKDLAAPTTVAQVTGTKGQDNWYRSNVTTELNGQDNEGGVGLQYTLYTLNDNDWFEYKEPLVFDQEGQHKITYQSYDKAENQEGRKTLEFIIDKTPPEAKVFVDQDKQDLVVAGMDENQTSVLKADNPATRKKDDALYIVTDQAGNTLKLDVRDCDKIKQDRFKIFSVQYNNEPLITEPNNHFNVLYKGEKGKFNVEEQNLELKNEVKIRIKYDKKKNQSTIITRQNGQEKAKETKQGLILLQLQTNQGNLDYSY